MRYYKWMFEDKPTVKRIPGFVFTSVEDAMEYTEDFEDWCHGVGTKNLFAFDGVEPTTIVQSLTSYFGARTPPYPTKELSEDELKRALSYFDAKPQDYFGLKVGVADIPLMLSVARTVGCIKCETANRKYVSGVEALYLWPTKMVKVELQELIASEID